MSDNKEKQELSEFYVGQDNILTNTRANDTGEVIGVSCFTDLDGNQIILLTTVRRKKTRG